MSVRLPDDIRGVDEANAELDRLMAADAAAEAPAGTVKATAESAPLEQRAAQPGEAVTPVVVPDPKVATSVAATTPATAVPATAPAPAAEKSRYAKAVERQERSWADLNAQKETLARERAEFTRVQAEHEAAKTKAEAEFSPEAYEDAANKFEAAGKFDLADLAKAKALELRKNPPAAKAAPAATAQQQQAAALEPQRREWALKAGVDFPDVAKTNSAMQLRVAQLLNEEPDLKAHPKGIYMAARIAALPGARTFEQLSDTEQFEELQRQAQEVGTLR